MHTELGSQRSPSVANVAAKAQSSVWPVARTRLWNPGRLRVRARGHEAREARGAQGLCRRAPEPWHRDGRDPAKVWPPRDHQPQLFPDLLR